MTGVTHVLLLEDSELDMQLVRGVLAREFPDLALGWARTPREYRAALADPDLDLVISDFRLPDYDGFRALADCLGTRSDLPFILLSGHVGEETAVECLKRGATDCVLKGNLGRLPLAVSRAMAEVAERTGRLRAERDRIALLQAASTARVVPWTFDPRREAWLFGASSKEVVGREPEAFAGDSGLLRSLLHPEDLGRFRAALDRWGKGVPEAIECRLRPGPGEPWRWTRWTFSAGGRQGVVQDISELHAVQDLLVRSQKSEALAFLIGGLCHDLNNLLHGVAACADLLAQEPLTPEGAVLAGTVLKACGRMRGVLGQFLGLARRGAEAPRQVQDLNALVREVGALVAPALPRGVALVSRRHPRPLWARVQADQIVQALLNLAINAMDALDGGGEIVLACGPGAPGTDLVSLEVEDSGPGIPEALRERIFDPYFTTKPPGRGTGLGLPMVQAIARGHGGTVAWEPREGRGSRFRLLLPGKEGPEPRLRVLVIEDQEPDAQLELEALRRLGFATLERRVDTAQALEAALGDGPWDLVLSDLSLPGFDGLAALLQVRGRLARVPFIFVSGTWDPEIRRRALDLGAQGFVSKNELHELERAVRGALAPEAREVP